MTKDKKAQTSSNQAKLDAAALKGTAAEKSVKPGAAAAPKAKRPAKSPVKAPRKRAKAPAETARLSADTAKASSAQTKPKSGVAKKAAAAKPSATVRSRVQAGRKAAQSRTRQTAGSKSVKPAAKAAGATSRAKAKSASDKTSSGRSARRSPPASVGTSLGKPVLVDPADLNAYTEAFRARTRALEKEIDDLREALGDSARITAAQAQALDDLEAKRKAADSHRAALAVELRRVNSSLVWQYAAVVRFMGRRLGPISVVSGMVFGLLLAILTGRVWDRTQRRMRRKALLDEDRAAILASELFDPAWYLANYPDVESYKDGPLEHFLRYGIVDNRNPNPVFDTAWYLAAYPDVIVSGRNPLAYYALFGIAQMHSASPEFDTHWYRVNNADHLTTGLTPLQHYIQAGQWIGVPTQALDAARKLETLASFSGTQAPAEPDPPAMRPAPALAKPAQTHAPVASPAPAPAESEPQPKPSAQEKDEPSERSIKLTLVEPGSAPRPRYANRALLFSRSEAR